jgi:YfiH family protein
MFAEVLMSTKWISHTNGICWEESALMNAAGFCHGVTGRSGGVSMNGYGSLNLALHVGDNAGYVRENRRRLCKTAGFSLSRLTTSQQTHGDNIVAVGLTEAGCGSASYEEALPHTDALMTNCTGIPLALFVADCVPVILYDPVHKACAVIHDGWRGTTAKLAAKTVFAMRIAYGTRSSDMLAYIGPSISWNHFEVGHATEQIFNSMGAVFSSCIIRKDTKCFIDLWAANKIMLEEAGICPEHIDVTENCVYDNEDKFFSYRRDQGITGRMAAFAKL